MGFGNALKCIASAIFFFLFAAFAFAEDLTVTMLDVGQADAILLETAGKRVLIDAGEQKKDVENQLRSKNIHHIDLVVATHPHADHIGGMQEVVENNEIKLYMDNGFPATSAGYNKLMDAVELKVSAGSMKYMVARQGQRLNFGPEAYFEVLWPTEEGLEGTRSDINANSIVLKLTHKNVCMLFMGDAEAETEQMIIPQIDKCHVYKASHHGSKHSSIPELLNKVRPDVALISCGLANKHGHPGASTLQTLESLGTDIYRTDLMGELTLVSDGDNLSVTMEHEPYVITKININLAPENVLRMLPGTGEKTAKALIEYRETYGPFENVEDVLKVGKSDMARKRLEKIIPFITVEGGSVTGLIADGSEVKRVPSYLRVVRVPLKVGTVRLVLPAKITHIKRTQAVAPVKQQEAAKPVSAIVPVAPAQAGANSGLININKADSATLAKMPGMSAQKAEAAVQYREQNGPFKDCKSLKNVKGIGAKTVEKLLSVCTVE